MDRYEIFSCSVKAFKMHTQPESIKSVDDKWFDRHGWIELRFLEKYYPLTKYKLERIGKGYQGESCASSEKDWCTEFKATRL